jgi:hypothetical protein
VDVQVKRDSTLKSLMKHLGINVFRDPGPGEDS